MKAMQWNSACKFITANQDTRMFILNLLAKDTSSPVKSAANRGDVKNTERPTPYQAIHFKNTMFNRILAFSVLISC